MDTRTFAVLRLLADGEFHSGEKIAETLGVSRGSIWNDLHVLDGSGLEIVKVRGRGYRLTEPLTLLDKKSIEQYLGARASKFTLEVHDSLASTNTLLLERAGATAEAGVMRAHGTVVAAEWQTQGRGRRGRAWVAAPGMALTFSVLWRFSQGAGALAGLSLAVGVAIARALEKLNIHAGLGLKWPNDVVWHGRKIAGVLIESQGDVLGPTAVVIGIGINVRLPEIAREQIDQAVVDLAEAGVTGNTNAMDRNRLLASLLIELDKVLTLFAQEGFAPLKDEWQRQHIYHRKAVKLVLPDGSKVAGEVEGVDKDGALLLATAHGRRRFHGGEVSLRL